MTPNSRPVSELGDTKGRLRLAVAAVVVALLSGALFFVHPMPARAEANADETQFFGMLNALRAKLVLPPLVSDPQLQNVARAWSSKMASDGGLSHNPALATQVTDWRTLGENVGTGGSVASIEAALEASPHHYENMTDKAFNYVGIGVVEVNGNIWVTEDFKQSKSGLPGTAVPAPAPSPTPKPAPKPAPAPRPPSGGGGASSTPRAPSTRASRSAQSPAASPAAAAAAAGSSGPMDSAASATSAPDPSPVTGPESAKPSASKARPLSAGLATSSTLDGSRLASLALFGVLAAIVLLATRGNLKLPASLRRR